VKKAKREDRIRENPSNVSLNDFEAVIKYYGTIKEGSKHPKAIIGKRVFPYKRTDPVQRPFVMKVLELIDNLRDDTGDNNENEKA